MAGTTLLTHVNVVGREPGLYSVLIKDGQVETISKGDIPVDGQVELVDCRRKDGSSLWLSPSLIDWHTHQKLNAVASHRLDLQSAKSASEALAMVKEALIDPRYDPVEEPNFVALNLRNATWSDSDRLDRHLLDELSLDRPIFLMFNGYHSMCCNTAGLKRFGIKVEDYPDGMLYEKDAFNISHDLSTVSEEVLDQWIDQEAKRAASLGVTEIVDLEMTFNIPAWQRRCASGFSTLRVHAGVYEEHIDAALKEGYKTGDDVAGCGGLVTVGPYKIITDGSLGSQTAYCHEAYPGTPDNFGLLTYEKPKLADMIKKGCENSFKMAIHAIGDHANHLTLTTVRETLQQHGLSLLKGSSIEHAQLLDFDDLPLFKELDLVASIQPCHLVDDRDLCHKFWPGREGRAYPFKSIVDAGIPVKMGSDAPIAPLHPWEAMAVAVSRSGEGEDNLGPFCEEQIIDIKTAYSASTWNEKTTIDEGETADICLISHDPLACGARGLREMKVAGTMLGGRWTWKAEDLLQ